MKADIAVSRRAMLSAIAGAACGACATKVSALGAQWRPAPAMPYAVQEIYPALHQGSIWIAGGFSPQSGGATERVIAFDITRGAWRDGPPLPTPSHHVQLASLGGELYAIGGFLGGDTRMRWICTPRVLRLVGDQWVESEALPMPMAESVSCVHRGAIHVIGGRTPRGNANAAYGDHNDIGDHFVLRPSEGWRRAAPLPLARNSAAGAYGGSAFHVVSGRTLEGNALDAHDIYDFSADRWRAGAAFPEARGGLAAAFWRGKLIAGGGERFQDGSVGTDLYACDNGAWASTHTLPDARHGYGLVAAGDALYALGGSGQVAMVEPLASVDVLS